jgi:hypothetical protein
LIDDVTDSRAFPLEIVLLSRWRGVKLVPLPAFTFADAEWAYIDLRQLAPAHRAMECACHAWHSEAA